MLATKKYVKNQIETLRESVENNFPSDTQMDGVITRLERVEKQVYQPEEKIKSTETWGLCFGWEDNRTLRNRVADNEDCIKELNNRILRLMDTLGYCEVTTEKKIEVKPCKKAKK